MDRRAIQQLLRDIDPETLESGNVKSQGGFFDRWVVPVSRRIDPLTRSVFGQSVVCVARKGS